MINPQRYIGFARKNTVLFQNFFNLGFIQLSNVVVQILLFPLIIHIVGLETFGYVAVAGTYAGLLALLINYGTNLSGIKDIAIGKNNLDTLSQLFSTIYQTKAVLFACSLAVPLILYGLSYNHTQYFVLATTIVLAEVLNPLFFFNGIEKLFVYNCVNLAAKLLSAALIILFVKTPDNACWVNFFLGLGNIIAYGILAIYAKRKYRLTWKPFSAVAIAGLIKDNFYLVCNSLATQIHQSFFLFLISFTSSPLTLGAYSLCDKIFFSFRLVLIAFSSAIYPKASIAYQENKEKWGRYKKNINGLLAIIFLVAGIVLFFYASLIVEIFTGKSDELASIYIRSICLVPLVAAVNSLNVIELLIRNQYRYLFYCGLTFMCISVIISFLLNTYATISAFGFYPLLAETCCMLTFLYFLRKSDQNPQLPAA